MEASCFLLKRHRRASPMRIALHCSATTHAHAAARALQTKLSCSPVLPVACNWRRGGGTPVSERSSVQYLLSGILRSAGNASCVLPQRVATFDAPEPVRQTTSRLPSSTLLVQDSSGPSQHRHACQCASWDVVPGATRIVVAYGGQLITAVSFVVCGAGSSTYYS